MLFGYKIPLWNVSDADQSCNFERNVLTRFACHSLGF